ncbi:hypothetical protein BHYA_0301g00020 [Botrytis hyacinthi]|uniref:Uncharacterized protein n=1 Tax=Botrytis hyacinthi TaxID=278943 RepID=A0A4Z1G9B4_9HELO|nr:hypothetical protein BHYA_0301g00020 [Botrytis hyacinthi]
MTTNSPDLQEQIIATQRKRWEAKTGGSGSLFLDEIKPGLEPVLAHPQPDWNKYTVAKFSQSIGRMKVEASRENKADSQPGANEHSAARRNTSLQQRSPPKPKATSTLVPPKKQNNHKIPRKEISRKPVLGSNVTYPGEVDYDKVLAAETHLSSQPPPKAAIPSQSRSQHEISNIPKKRPSHHGAHNDLKRVSNDSRPPDMRRTPAEDKRTKSTRGQNKGIIFPKTRETPALPPRYTHKKDGSSTSQQHPQVSRLRAVAGQHHRPTTSDMQNSRKVKDLAPRSHTNQMNDSQPLVNYSYPSDRFRS